MQLVKAVSREGSSGHRLLFKRGVAQSMVRVLATAHMTALLCWPTAAGGGPQGWSSIMNLVCSVLFNYAESSAAEQYSQALRQASIEFTLRIAAGIPNVQDLDLPGDAASNNISSDLLETAVPQHSIDKIIWS